MSTLYVIKPINEDGKTRTTSSLVQIEESKISSCAYPLVGVMTTEEFEKLDIDQNAMHESLVSVTQSENNYVDIYPDYIVGSFSIPNKQCFASEPNTFAFYVDKKRLIFVDDDNSTNDILQQLVAGGIMNEPSTIHCLYLFFKELLIDDLQYLSRVEDQMEDLEEYILSKKIDIKTTTLMKYRRETMRYSAYYQQMATMASVLSDNENSIMTRTEAHSFDHIENLADRLTSRAETLKEYSLQLHDLHQTQIDISQNSIMQILTIVTVLFAPLTLVTGWFGMNLVFIPGVDLTWTWLILIAIALVSTVALLIWFHKRKWL